jgi:hypothetical protein
LKALARKLLGTPKHLRGRPEIKLSDFSHL